MVETGATTPVISDVDIVLYDTFGQIHGRGLDLADFVRDSGGAKVVIYSWNLKPERIQEALAVVQAATCLKCSPDQRSSTHSSESTW